MAVVAGVTFIGFGIAILAAVLFGLLRWVGIEAGSFLDWAIGVAVFEWLLVITTVPWNIHFTAKEALDEVERSRTQGITVNEEDAAYARRMAGRFFWVAVGLHIVSAAGLYALAFFGVSAIGYFGSAAALLLTFLRPVLRAAQYVFARLRAVRDTALHPREDVNELRSRVTTLEFQSETLRKNLEEQGEKLEELAGQNARLAAQLREQTAENLQAHERLSREARSAIAQLNTDSQVLDHVRELVRFFKSA